MEETSGKWVTAREFANICGSTPVSVHRAGKRFVIRMQKISAHKTLFNTEDEKKFRDNLRRRHKAATAGQWPPDSWNNLRPVAGQFQQGIVAGGLVKAPAADNGRLEPRLVTTLPPTSESWSVYVVSGVVIMLCPGQLPVVIKTA